MRSPWAIYKGDNLTSDQIDHLISLGALNRDEVIIAKVNQPDNFRLFPKAVVAMLVDFGVFLSLVALKPYSVLFLGKTPCACSVR